MTPATVLMTTGKNTLPAIVTIFEVSPMPKTININGNKASVGMGINAMISGDTKCRIGAYNPIHKPMIIPGITPNKNPASIRKREIPIWLNSSPLVSKLVKVDTI